MNTNLLALDSNVLLIVTFVLAIVLVFLAGITILLVLNVRGKLSTQKLKFHGTYSQNANTRENYAEIIVSNPTLNNIGIKGIGIQNDKVRYDLTALYRVKAGLSDDERIIIEQRDSISFTLSEDELAGCLRDGKGGKEVGKLRVYAIDFTGAMFKRSLNEVKPLVINIKNNINSGNPPKKSTESPKPTVKGLKPLGTLGEMKPMNAPKKEKPAEHAAPAEKKEETENA